MSEQQKELKKMEEIKQVSNEEKSVEGFYWCNKCTAVIHFDSKDKEAKCTVKDCGNIDLTKARFQLGAESKLADNWIFMNVMYSKRNNKKSIYQLRAELNNEFSRHLGLDDLNLSLLQDIATLHSLAYIKNKKIKITITKATDTDF